MMLVVVGSVLKVRILSPGNATVLHCIYQPLIQTSMSMPSPEEVATQPEYHLHDLDLSHGQCTFLKLDAQAYRRSIFMDHRTILRENQETVRVPLDVMHRLATESATGPGQTAINYVFHTAFCCSTLISKCLDIEGSCRVLREPQVLMQLSSHLRSEACDIQRDASSDRLLDTVLFLLAKSTAGGEPTVIKPTNAANNLAPGVLRHPRTQGVILLYSSLEQFLVSIIKKGEEGRIFVRKLFNIIRMDSERTRALNADSVARLTDLQIAAFVWYQQLDTYLWLLECFPDANIKTLDCEIFLAEPLATLVKLCDHFGIKTELKVQEAVIAGPAFRKHSKDGVQDYDSSTRKAEYSRIAEQNRSTLDGIMAWSERIRPEGPLSLPLPRTL